MPRLTPRNLLFSLQNILPYGEACSLLCRQAVEEEEETVCDVHGTHARIEIEAQQVQVGVEGVESSLNAFAYDVVGYASEGLQTDDVLHAVAIEPADVRGQQPSFSKLRRHGHDALGAAGIVVDIRERTEIAETAARAVHLLLFCFYEFIERMDHEIGRGAIAQTQFLLYLRVHELLQEEGRDERGHHLYAFLNESAADELMGERIEL